MSSTYDGERTPENKVPLMFMVLLSILNFVCIRFKIFEDSLCGETTLDATLPLKQPQ